MHSICLSRGQDKHLPGYCGKGGTRISKQMISCISGTKYMSIQGERERKRPKECENRLTFFFLFSLNTQLNSVALLFFVVFYSVAPLGIHVQETTTKNVWRKETRMYVSLFQAAGIILEPFLLTRTSSQTKALLCL